MLITAPDTAPPVGHLNRLDVATIELRMKSCARLPSLSSIDRVLRELVNAEECFTSQVADVIRRDPSMTTRLLRLVNSVYFGLSLPVTSIEEAVFYLGVRQVRQLAMVTPVIEDLQKLSGKAAFPWHSFWQHCVSTAILTPEILSDAQWAQDETDYVAGLLHDVGKIVMAAVFPEYFAAVHACARQGKQLLEMERQILGMDHCELGGMYLRHHNLPDTAVQAALFHHQPELAPRHARYVAAVHIADLLVRHAEIGDSGNYEPVPEKLWTDAPAWGILFPGTSEEERPIAAANLRRSLERLPAILEGMV
jgi:putative nucleotidyltransferase with HDIG domain